MRFTTRRWPFRLIIRIFSRAPVSRGTRGAMAKRSFAAARGSTSAFLTPRSRTSRPNWPERPIRELFTSNSLGLPRSIDVYQRLVAAGVIGVRPITLADVAPLNIKAAPGVPLEVRFRLGPNYRNPTTYQSSLGVQRDLGGGVSLELGYQFTRGLHLSRNRDINQFKLTGPVSPLNPLGGPTYIRFPTAAQTQAGLTTDFSNQFRFQDNVYENTASSFYHSFTAQAQRRFSRSFSLNAHYTLAKSIDEVVDFNSDWSAQNPLNLRLDRSLSSFDQRHRLVLSGVFQSTAQNVALKNWALSPIFVAQSGRPFNLLLGFDANADGRSQSDRP